MTSGRPVTACQLDEIERCYRDERTDKLALRLGLSVWAINKIAREKQLRLTARQRWLKRSPYARGR